MSKKLNTKLHEEIKSRRFKADLEAQMLLEADNSADACLEFCFSLLSNLDWRQQFDLLRKTRG